jgi:hypothetical protein
MNQVLWLENYDRTGTWKPVPRLILSEGAYLFSDARQVFFGELLKLLFDLPAEDHYKAREDLTAPFHL